MPHGDYPGRIVRLRRAGRGRSERVSSVGGVRGKPIVWAMAGGRQGTECMASCERGNG
jgi:hypothetical protein